MNFSQNAAHFSESFVFSNTYCSLVLERHGIQEEWMIKSVHAKDNRTLTFLELYPTTPCLEVKRNASPQCREEHRDKNLAVSEDEFSVDSYPVFDGNHCRHWHSRASCWMLFVFKCWVNNVQTFRRNGATGTETFSADYLGASRFLIPK
jgi:hypothetical protein